MTNFSTPKRNQAICAVNKWFGFAAVTALVSLVNVAYLEIQYAGNDRTAEIMPDILSKQKNDGNFNNHYVYKGKRILTAVDDMHTRRRMLANGGKEDEQFMSERIHQIAGQHRKLCEDPAKIHFSTDIETVREMYACTSMLEGRQEPFDVNVVADSEDEKGFSENQWLLSEPMKTPRRNHDCVILEDERSGGDVVLLNLLGRNGRSIERTNLVTGESTEVRTPGRDPAGFDLSNLNHVYAAVVTSLSEPAKKEIWIPCGFHGDAPNKEISSRYSRIIDADTLEVRVGPKLPTSGGACVAAALPLDGPNKPAHVCSFGGTDGKHDSGKFLNSAQCYDRIKQKWHYPFPKLPYGFDHGNLVHVPAGLCHPEDPSRILVMNYRVRIYGEPRPEILGFDLPKPGSPVADAKNKNEWYLFYNVTSNHTDPHNVARDAGGVVTANGGRYVVNFGGRGVVDDGKSYYMKTRGGGTRVRTSKFSRARVFDTCHREWKDANTELGIGEFALQTCASHSLNLAVTCGGQSNCDLKGRRFFKKNNAPWCIINRVPGLEFDNTHE
eukprot:CAMPEP_0195508772 /NCGR_PEP_ID=MMETSP0794_2-20130614/1896_1 /TAXON_ID=515487 /ORGANISM="Stephanopyxis turris, Strain CCMP 815" /LENGTH=552 /DNA_ID=CAMNT_0040635823 /DNA_START=44 /DNA_END=1702 /DNA_ORIENTATION=+